jgi:predicted amidohydrolase
VRVSLVQFAATTDTSRNLETITRLIGRSASAVPPQAVTGSRGGEADAVHLVVLPEGAMHDVDGRDRSLGEVAEPVDGPFVAALARLAKDRRVVLVAGVLETSDDAERPFNTLVVLDADGRLAASYRKVHLYDSFGYRESERLAAGRGDLAVLPLGGLTLGLQTCYDLRFPELSRALVDAGADVLVVPAAWVKGSLKEDHWATLLRARAIENTAYVLGAGQCGRTYIGCSMVVDPMGVVLAGLGAGEGVATAVIDRSAIEEARRVNPSLANRRLPLRPG